MLSLEIKNVVLHCNSYQHIKKDLELIFSKLDKKVRKNPIFYCLYKNKRNTNSHVT